MKINKIKVALLTLVLMVCPLMSVVRVFADDVPSSTMTVSPPNQRIILIPGEKYRGSINISNPSGAKQKIGRAHV